MQLEPDRRTLVGSVSAFFCAAAEGAQVSRRSQTRPGKVGARAAPANSLWTRLDSSPGAVRCHGPCRGGVSRLTLYRRRPKGLDPQCGAGDGFALPKSSERGRR